jgi:indole-3-glycerol phosphate synthase
MSETFLAEMARGSRARVREAKRAVPEATLFGQAASTPAPPPLQRAAAGFDLIAELKLRSPAAGVLADAAEDLPVRVQRYARAGAAAVSVLTEPSRFDGSLEHLKVAARALSAARVPVMRKDFLVDPYQILEARAAGASGVLLILRMLDDAELAALTDCALESGLFALLEAFDEPDLERAGALVEARRGATGAALLLVGVNCRDLATLQVVPGRLEQLAPRLPAHVARVAESGVTSTADAARVAAAGYDLALVGSALMGEGDPGRLVAAMLAAGREARARGRR